MVQSYAKTKTDLTQVDAASFAAHKFYGPKGAGFLYLRAGVPIDRIGFGGSHEGERRPGTENVPAIVGMAKAAEIAAADHARDPQHERERQLREMLWQRIAAAFPAARLNGDARRCLANTLNVSFPGLSSETMLMALDLEGVCASSGSACMVGSVVASHVLLAMGLSPELATSAIRFSLGKDTTAEEIAGASRAIARVIERLQRVGARAETYAVA
jgi:cysteine desulfurase